MMRASLVDGIGDAIGPVERETLNERVYRELKNSIMAGAFRPGSELTLRAVAEALGTSLMPVRDAMRRLVAERALEVLPSRKIAIPMLTVEDFLELRRVRILLEGEAVAIAASKIGRRELNAVRALLKRLETLAKGGDGDFWRLNQKLHFTIYEAAGSRTLLSIIETLWLQVGPLFTRIPVARAVKNSADPHHLLYKALEAHDPAAARAALEADLTDATDQMMKELARQNAIRA